MDLAKPENPFFDYTPCNYFSGNVICDKIPLDEVKKVFRRTSFPRLASAKLILHPYIFIDKFIPEDVFGTKLILDINLEYSSDSGGDIELQVDANAFRSTKSYTNQFKIHTIDCTNLNLGFLSGFDKLIYLDLTNIFNIQYCLPSLPPLPNLNYLDISYCTGMNHLNIFPTLTNGLKGFSFDGDVDNIMTSYNDDTVGRIIDWLLLSSANTLKDLGITYMNRMTRIPNKIASFKALERLWLNENNISTIKFGAFSFSVPVSLLHIGGNEMKEIEPGAFQGKHDNVTLYTLQTFYEFLNICH